MKNQFTERLKELLVMRGISQSELAKAINTTPTSVSYWINGKRQPLAESIYIIAQYLGVSSDYLLGLSDKM